MNKYLMVSFRTGKNWRYNIKHPWIIFPCVYYEIKFFIQRGLYGYSNNEVSDLEGYLCRWLPTALREMKGIAFPWKLTAQKWDGILEKIAVGFEATQKIMDLEYDWHNKKEERKLKKVSDKGLELFKEYFMNLWV